MEKRTQMKVAMTYGAIYGLASSIIYLIFYFAGASIDNKAPQYVGWIVLIASLFIGIKSYRDQDLDGYISYGKSLGTGTLIGLFGGIITGVFSVLMFTVIDPGLAQKIIEKAQEDMIERGNMSEDQINLAVSWTRKFMNPIALFLFSILGSIFMSFIFSLLISIFTKKEQTPFNG
ncbi:hypothetical protein BH11BAC1_BH11BAC1_10810 [soil metagenome]